MIVALSHSAHPHPVSDGLLTPLTIVASFLQEYLALLALHSNKTLIAVHVPPLGVGVDDPVLLPLSQTLVLPLLKHLGPVEAVEES